MSTTFFYWDTIKVPKSVYRGGMDLVVRQKGMSVTPYVIPVGQTDVSYVWEMDYNVYPKYIGSPTNNYTYKKENE